LEGTAMLLAADVGNTNVKLGIFDGDNLKFKLRFSTDENKTSDELAVELYCRFTTSTQKTLTALL
jgi:type III pantothenate kinase